MPVENTSETPPLKGRRVPRILLGLVGVMFLSALIFLLFVGRWLVLEDPLEKAQAIVVLSGRMPIRAMEAAKLYREGYAPKVWLTHSTEPGATLEAMGISYAGEDSYNLRVLIHEGVPTDDIRVLEPAIVNTADEIAAVSAALDAGKELVRDHCYEQSTYAPRAHSVAPACGGPGAGDYTGRFGRPLRAAPVVAHDGRCPRRRSRIPGNLECLGRHAVAPRELEI